MVWSGTDWTTVVSVAVGAGVTIASLWKKLEQKDPQLVKELPKKVVTVADDVASFFENIAKSPFFAGEVAAGELKAKHVLDELTQTKAVSEAKTVLLGIGKVYASLTDAEKLKAEVTLKLALSGIGIAMTDTQIQSVFAEAQKAIEAIQATPVFKASFEQPAEPQS